MRIILLRAKINDWVCICEKLVGCQGMPDLIMRHDKHCVCALCARFVASLRHAPKIFTECGLPDLCCRRIVHQLSVTADGAACYRVYHRVGVVFEIDGDFGVLFEFARCMDEVERCLFLEGK